MMSYNPPAGWRIDWDLEFDGVNDFDMVWRVYQWQSWTEKKWFRKPIERKGWKAVFGSRHRSSAEAWVKSTIEALELERKNNG